jgi:CRP/FNR family transcriptional regulator, anaerobic regulatory protein
MTYNNQPCSSCNLLTSCFPLGFNEEEFKEFDKITDKIVIYRKNDYLYKENDAFSCIFILRVGCVKSYKKNSNEEKEDRVRFYYPGEILGLNALTSDNYQENAIVLETSSVCKLYINVLSKTVASLPLIQKRLIKLMSNDLLNSIPISLNSSAEARMAAFLINLSNKMKNSGFSPNHLKLNMSRQDISIYLGIVPETVSRIISNFKTRKIIDLNKKHIYIKELQELKKIAS